MEILQHSFLSSSALSLPPQTERQVSSRPQFPSQLCAPPASVSASLNRRGRPLRGFCKGSNELVSKASSIASESTSSSSRSAPCIVIVMRANAAGGYASALAEVGRSQNVLEGINADMGKLGNYLQDKQLYSFLTNPTISDKNKKSVLKSLADNANFVSYTVNLLNLIVDKKRTILLKDIVKEFAKLYNEITNTEVVIVTSAVKINTNQLAQIAKKIQSMSGAKNVRMKNVVDTSLVAGFVVRYGKDGSRFVDMSVKGQLTRIASHIELGDRPRFAGV
ncbi:hypothetical protein L7F22_068803 [Adiantum nelumboides]|nr:hypothetical protein [Adiantum nelumboides]